MLLKDHIPALRYGAKIQPNELLGVFTTGNTYYVVKDTWSYADEFKRNFETSYNDNTTAICPDVGTTTGTAAVAVLNTGIQDALNKCVDARGDYVVVLPSADDYDIGAALSMTKRNVHLVCPLGMNWDYGASNACKINQIGAYSTINVQNQNIEIAGLYIKPLTTYAAITLMNGGSTGYAWGLSIHHNTFWWYGTTTYVIGPETDAGDGGSYSSFYRNYFMPAGGSTTTTDVIRTENEATFVKINENVCINANSNTLSNVINCKSVGGQVSNNVIGDGNGSTITRAITISKGLASGNMLGTSATTDIAPSGNTNGAVGNWSGATGGAAASQAS